MRQLNEKDVALLHMSIQRGYQSEAELNQGLKLEAGLQNLQDLLNEERTQSAHLAGRLSYYFGIYQRYFNQRQAENQFSSIEEIQQAREEMFKNEDSLLYAYRAAWMTAFNN